MANDVKAWLPASAMSDGALCMNLTEQMVQWSRRWFGSAEGTSVRLRKPADKARIPLGAACWELDGLSLALDRVGQLRIAATMLGLKQVKPKLADQDLTLDLQSHHEEEDGHQAVVDPVMQ